MAGKLGIGDLAAMGLGNVGIGPLNVGNVLDTVDFVKRAWASIGVPSSFAPTVDLEELDKRIADLKAVEQWLTVNMNMLQGTIQALEIQRGTIATLKAFGAPVAAAAPATQAIASALARASRPQAALPQAAMPSVAASEATAPAEQSPRRAKPARRKGRGAATTEPAAFADPGLSPSAWWNLLQSQFNQVAAAALSGVGLPRPEAGASQAREKRTREKPAREKSRRAARAGAARARRADGADVPAGATTAANGRRGSGGRKD
ncbi:MAG TPA: hypothetical protein PKB08_08595 [Burkholderiaceae bacterium]|jgi:hypothetical protein|nr:hypothetical protein [Burkholderiaceae bacterium]